MTACEVSGKGRGSCARSPGWVGWRGVVRNSPGGAWSSRAEPLPAGIGKWGPGFGISFCLCADWGRGQSASGASPIGGCSNANGKADEIPGWLSGRGGRSSRPVRSGAERRRRSGAFEAPVLVKSLLLQPRSARPESPECLCAWHQVTERLAVVF